MDTINEDTKPNTPDRPIPDVASKLMADIDGTVLVIGNDLRPRWVSTSDGSILGRRSSDWGAGTLADRVHPADQVWLQRARHEVLTTSGATAQGYVRVQDDEGDYSTVLLTATNRFDDPDINGLVVTLLPAPDEGRAAPARDDVQRAMAASRQDALLDEARSQIQSSLSSISAATAALSVDGLADQAKRVHVGVIDSATTVLTTLLDDIVDLSKVSNGTMELDSIVFSPARLLNDVTAAFEPVCTQRDVELALELDTDLPPQVKGDPARLEQVLHHLISNAVGSATGGLVSVNVKVVQDTTVQFRVAHAGTGSGVAVFDSFAPDRRRLSDADIRLSIARQVVELMNGSFGYETSDRATAIWFDVSFGHARRLDDRPQEPKPETVSSSTTAHILIVDDSDVNRLLASSQLERLGHTFATAEGGQEALAALKTGAFDLVLMDWHMPGIDGLEVTRQWRAEHDPDHHLPIITMTASAMAGDRERCLAAGASDYLSKPVSISDLGAMIARWARPAGADSEASPEPSLEDQPVDRAPADATTPQYDQTKIAALIADLGEVGVVRSIVHAFRDMVPQYCTAAEEALAIDDRATVRRCAHTLKSTALMLGADELAASCITLESAAVDAESVDLEALVDEFSLCCTRAEVGLADLARQLDTTAGQTQ